MMFLKEANNSRHKGQLLENVQKIQSTQESQHIKCKRNDLSKNGGVPAICFIHPKVVSWYNVATVDIYASEGE